MGFNMGNMEYGIIKHSDLDLPVIDLLRVPFRGESLTIGYPAFGPEFNISNLRLMGKNYNHKDRRVSFREATTPESVAAIAYRFGEMANPDILHNFSTHPWIQLGSVVKASGGVFINPPKDDWGDPIVDERVLKKWVDRGEKVNGIWLYDGQDARDFSYVPYETFKQGHQDSGDFARGGLARGIEHTRERVAVNLEGISSKEFHNLGINVHDFAPVDQPTLRLISLYSNYDELSVGGSCGNCYSGFAFGIFNSKE